MKKLTYKKSIELEKILKNMYKVAVAYSGGVDSTLVLEVSKRVLGKENVLAVIVDSELFNGKECDKAINLAKTMGIKTIKVKVNELEYETITGNSPESWYHSKKLQYKTIKKVAKNYGFNFVLDGTIMDDEKDFRPGLKARNEEKIRSVLQEVSMYKKEVRELAKEYKINIWNKPASCSLASRIPYGMKINLEKIKRINKAEEYILNKGFSIVRVRYYDNMARIEVLEKEINKLLLYRNEIDKKLRQLGFDYVTVDLEGYRTGSMNEILANKVI